MSDFNLNDHVYRLLQSEPFFAALSRRIEKKMNKSIPTAGVRVNEDGYFEMVYNPDFFEPLTDKQRAGVLVHEFYHLVFEHVTGRLPDELAGVMQGKPSPEQAQKFKLWNIAADLSINYHIGADNLPEKCCIPGGPMFEDMPGDKTAEWYYNKLIQKVEEQQEQSQGQGEPGEGDGQGGGSGVPGNQPFDPDEAGQFDSHDEWGEGQANEIAQEALDIAKERLKETVKKAGKKAGVYGVGTAVAGGGLALMADDPEKVNDLVRDAKGKAYALHPRDVSMHFKGGGPLQKILGTEQKEQLEELKKLNKNLNGRGAGTPGVNVYVGDKQVKDIVVKAIDEMGLLYTNR